MKEMMAKDCVFCKIARGEIKKDPFNESDNFCAFEDINPLTKGHMLIVPKKHYVTLLDIPDRLGGEMLMFTKKVADKLMDEKLGDGFNILMNNLEVAGQDIFHAHLHVIPRKEGDGKIKFDLASPES
jgi:histidine triad (HIT) family protein